MAADPYSMEQRLLQSLEWIGAITNAHLILTGDQNTFCNAMFKHPFVLTGCTKINETATATFIYYILWSLCIVDATKSKNPNRTH